jgi:hypothetical protein
LIAGSTKPSTLQYAVGATLTTLADVMCVDAPTDDEMSIELKALHPITGVTIGKFNGWFAAGFSRGDWANKMIEEDNPKRIADIPLKLRRNIDSPLTNGMTSTEKTN